jgi:hypothetical protein
MTLKIIVSYAIKLQLNYDDAKGLPMVTNLLQSDKVLAPPMCKIVRTSNLAFNMKITCKDIQRSIDQV